MMFIAKRVKALFMLLFLCTMAFSQSGITESATLSFSDAEGDCGLGTRTVLLEVDISGLTGTGGQAAGLNSYVLTFDISRPIGLSTNVFVTAQASSPPIMNWDFDVTERDLVDATLRVTVVGWVAAADAPNSNYAVAELLFMGTAGDITLTFDPATSSLGSRVVLVEGDGPGAIPIEAPSTPYTFTLTVDFPLDLPTGIISWLTVNPDYDLAQPMGPINLLDLTKLLNCGAM